MAYNTTAVRDLIVAAFNHEELDAFCYTHARPLLDHFAESYTLTLRAQKLVEYAERHGSLETIVSAIKAENPHQYGIFEPKLLTAPPGLPDTEGVDVRPLPTPMQRYDPFLSQLVQGLRRWDGTSTSYPRCVISAMATALHADLAYILRSDGAAWQVDLTLDDRAQKEAERHLGNSQIREALLQTTRLQASSLYQEKGVRRPHLIVPCRGTQMPQLLVFYNLRGTVPLDATISLVLETVLQITRNFSLPIPVELLELSIYHALRQRLGYVSDSIYQRQFELFSNRLDKMTVYFEPIVYLHPTQPYIWGWEALARDPETKRTPVDLFGIAELWGRRFQLELDMHFLRTALRKYVELPGEVEGPQRVRRKEELPPLSVNVYPESLIRTRYFETVRELYVDGRMPLNKLTLEISEKSQLPSPDNPGAGDAIRWFREHLFRLEQLDLRFAIDDFGVGYASTSRLSRLGPSCVKIDRDALLDKFGEYTFDYVLDFARNVPGQVQVIVEGVDYDSIFPLRALYERGIRYVQGHSLGVAQPFASRLQKEEFARICTALQPTLSLSVVDPPAHQGVERKGTT